MRTAVQECAAGSGTERTAFRQGRKSVFRSRQRQSSRTRRQLFPGTGTRISPSQSRARRRTCRQRHPASGLTRVRRKATPEEQKSTTSWKRSPENLPRRNEKRERPGRRNDEWNSAGTADIVAEFVSPRVARDFLKRIRPAPSGHRRHRLPHKRRKPLRRGRK